MNGALATFRAVDLKFVGLAALGVGLAFAAAYAPWGTSFTILGLAAACAFIWRLGLRLGAWCLFVATCSIRNPLSIDVVGTASIFANDLLLLGLAAMVFWEHGVRDILARSATFRIGLVLAAIAVAGLYTATRLAWGVNLAKTEVFQVAIFYVAWHLVRDPRSARATMFAFLLGLLPAVFVGFHQSTISVQELQETTGIETAIVWDDAGKPFPRVHSTFDNALYFSHALSMGVGVGLGLLTNATRSAKFLLVAIVALLARCNQFTYSMGGLLGMGSAVFAAAFGWKRRWMFIALPVGIVAFALLAPPLIYTRIELTLTGTNPTSIARILTYKQTLDVLMDHPIFGVGWGSIASALSNEYRMTHDTIASIGAENYFLQRALATGLVGMTLTIVICVLFFRHLRGAAAAEAAGWPRRAVLYGGIAFYAQGQIIPSADPNTIYILWTLFAVAERMRIAAREAAP